MRCHNLLQSEPTLEFNRQAILVMNDNPINMSKCLVLLHTKTDLFKPVNFIKRPKLSWMGIFSIFGQDSVSSVHTKIKDTLRDDRDFDNNSEFLSQKVIDNFNDLLLLPHDDLALVVKNILKLNETSLRILLSGTHSQDNFKSMVAHPQLIENNIDAINDSLEHVKQIVFEQICESHIKLGR